MVAISKALQKKEKREELNGWSEWQTIAGKRFSRWWNDKRTLFSGWKVELNYPEGWATYSVCKKVLTQLTQLKSPKMYSQTAPANRYVSWEDYKLNYNLSASNKLGFFTFRKQSVQYVWKVVGKYCPVFWGKWTHEVCLQDWIWRGPSASCASFAQALPPTSRQNNGQTKTSTRNESQLDWCK